MLRGGNMLTKSVSIAAMIHEGMPLDDSISEEMCLSWIEVGVVLFCE